MANRSLHTFQDVVEWGLCVGCGACASKTTGGARMVHVESEGFRPVFDGSARPASQIRLDVCPSYRLDADLNTAGIAKRSTADHEFGSTLEIWEGWSAEPAIRFKGSSGGMLTALSLYCLEVGGFKGVIHAGMDPDQPWMNRNFISRTREEILARTGSRYAPSAPCAAVDDVRDSEGPFVFIGKPCDAAAVSEMRRHDSVLREKIGLVLTFFCAGTPSTRGTLDLVDHLDVPRSDIKALHYRGEGWPGRFRVVTDPPQQGDKSLTYKESWGRLTSYRPLRCNLCPDGLGRIADIACGDAWEQYADDGDPGRSLVLVRTEAGRRILAAARAAGYATLQTAGADNVLRAQANLLTRRRELFGRLLAFRLLGAPIPSFEGFSLMRSWLRIGPKWQVKTLLGTVRRIVQRGWYRRRPRRSAMSSEAIQALSPTK